MEIQHPERGMAREEYDKNKRRMDILWMTMQTILILAVALFFIMEVWN